MLFCIHFYHILSSNIIQILSPPKKYFENHKSKSSIPLQILIKMHKIELYDKECASQQSLMIVITILVYARRPNPILLKANK